MRVLQVMAGAEFGGAEAFFVRLVIGLHKAGLDQRVIIRKNEQRAQVLRDAGLEPVELSFGGLLDLKTPMMIKRELRTFRPQVVLTWMNRATSKMPSRRPSDLNYVLAARLGGYYNLKYYKKCDHLVGNTEDICDYLGKENWPQERIHYLPNFVAADHRPPAPRNKLHIPERSKMILTLGRLHANKAFDTLIRALAHVPDAYLVIAGEGPEREALESLAQELGVRPRIRMLGWRDDVPELMAACDLFVCPSRHEPLGNVVIEAWAQDRPVVATDSVGPAALIKDGVDGLLTPVDDAPALAKAINRVLKDDVLAGDLAQAGRQHYERKFTEQMVVQRYLDFFQEIAD
ncbi:glycosyltransferase [Magnetovibrio blakemorei]|uniref:Glycosyl transferase n=1 Tax=Magnetovibrio blakemorei TaxID=28181 RepID=A0A1E5Q5Q8_9PROT|nr:glycosyltransferase [Magnetovibrio blakemorei]OEJ65696.1 glycosyl transferase [Magnetovibrio blakemorei]